MSEQGDSVGDLAERIASYVETALTYDQWSKHEAMVEAVRIACEDARHSTLTVILGRDAANKAMGT